MRTLLKFLRGLPVLATIILYNLCITYAQQPLPIGTDKFCGLDDTDAPNTLQNCESQNTLNTEANILGTAVMKRHGYVQTAALTIATSAVTGAYYFIDKNGNQQVIVCQDINCAHSVNGGAFSVIYSTATSGVARWSFADYNGAVYAVDDKNDQPWTYDGTTFTQPVSSNSFPSGSLIEQSKDRLIISGVTANPSGVYYSQSGIFSNFVTNGNSADPWVDTIGTTGDKVTAIKYDSGNLYAFKRNSITLCILADQFSTVCYPIANTIGTSSPQSIVSAPDGIYFQSQTGSFWRIPTYGLYGLELISRKIYNFVKNQPSQFGAVGSNFQGALADWNAGTQTPSGSFNTATNVGSIFNSSWTFNDSNSTFINGTVVNVATTTTGLGLIEPSNQTFTNATGELGVGINTNWTLTGSPAWGNISALSNDWWAISQSCSLPLTLNILDATGTQTLFTNNYSNLTPTGAFQASGQYWLLNSTGATNFTSLNNPFPGALNVCTQGATIQLPNILSKNTNAIELQFIIGSSILTSVPYIRGSSICIAATCGYSSINVNGMAIQIYGTPTGPLPQVFVTTGSYQSPAIDTTYTSPIYGPFVAAISSNTHSQVTFSVGTSANGTSFGTFSNIANGNRITSTANRYAQYYSTFTIDTATNTLASISTVTLQAATTGQFVTQCIQPGPNIISWGLLTCDTSSNIGAGSEVFYATSAVNCASLPTGPPLNSAGVLQNGWTQQTNNASLTIATNSALFIAWRDLLGSSTDQAQINSCQTNWANGITPQPVWGVYDPIKNSIYWSTSSSGTATNNRILKYDLNIAGNSYYFQQGQAASPWFPWSINATALRMINNLLYFGSSTAGTWNQYGASGSNADNGAAINGYWQSKDFSCNAPFVDSVWNRTYAVARNQQGGTITQTLTNSLNSIDSYSISTSTSAAQNYVRATHSIQNFTAAPFANVNFANNAANNPFEIDGFSLSCTPQPPIDENP